MARKFTTKDGSRNKAIVRRVVQMRDSKNDPKSWAAIAEKLGVAPRTARRLYDEAKGAGAHFESRPLVGGRNRTEESSVEAN